MLPAYLVLRNALCWFALFEKIDKVEHLDIGLYKCLRGCKEGRNGLMPYLGTDETQQGNYQ